MAHSTSLRDGGSAKLSETGCCGISFSRFELVHEIARVTNNFD